MKNFFRRLKYHMTPGETLTKNQNILLAATVFAAIALGLSSIYVNMYIYISAIAENPAIYAIGTVIRFNLYSCLYSGLAFLFVGYVGQKIVPRYCMFLGFIFYIVLYFLLLSYQQDVYMHIGLLALVNALASSFYYVSINCVMPIVTDDRGRGMFLAVQGATTAICALLTPLIAGFAIDAITVLQGGYMMVFTVSMMFLCGSVICTLIMPKSRISVPANNFTRVLFRPIKDKGLALAVTGEFFRALRETVMTFLMPLLLFIMCDSNGIVGIYCFICIALQIASSIIAKKYMIAQNRKTFLFIGCVICVISSVLFLNSVDEMMVFAYGILTSVTYGFTATAAFDIYYYAANRVKKPYMKMYEITAAREFYVSLGRSIGVFIVLLMSAEFLSIVRAIVAIGISQIFVWVFYSLVRTGRY